MNLHYVWSTYSSRLDAFISFIGSRFTPSSCTNTRVFVWDGLWPGNKNKSCTKFWQRTSWGTKAVQKALNNCNMFISTQHRDPALILYKYFVCVLTWSTETCEASSLTLITDSVNRLLVFLHSSPFPSRLVVCSVGSALARCLFRPWMIDVTDMLREDVDAGIAETLDFPGWPNTGKHEYAKWMTF
jgi:hypothetical protein